MLDNLPQLLNHRDRDRLERYRRYLDFYAGVHWQTAPQAGQRQLTFNYAKVFVDKISSYVMSGTTPTVRPLQDTAEGKLKARRAEEALQEVAEQNHLSLLDFDTEVDCSVLGDAAYKVTWDAREGRVRITTPDVQGLFAWWLGDDVSRVVRVASRYTLAAADVLDLYGKAVKGASATLVEDWTDSVFSTWIDGTMHDSVPNPYGFMPFVLYPNLREPKKFWGTSDLPIFMEAQRELNRALSQLSRILELSGNPVAVLENIEESEDIAVAPGAVWNLPEGARAYLLDLLKGGGVKLHMDYVNLLYRVMHDVSESPRAAFGGTDRDLSGIALEVEMRSLVQKAQRKRLIRTTAFRRRSAMVLKLLEQRAGEDFSGLVTDVVWAPLLPQDVLTLAKTEQVLVTTGLHSRQRAMTELGILDPAAEIYAVAEERRRLGAG